MKEPEKRKAMKKEVKAAFEEKYKTPSLVKSDKQSHVAFFFKKLRF
jgi:hypothetical protein